MSFEKHYIGKGTQLPNIAVIKVTIKMEDAEEHIYERDGAKYLSFEIAQMQQPDKFNRTHTAYVSKRVDDQKPAKKKSRARAK